MSNSHALNLNQRGLELGEQGQLRQAWECFSEAIKLEPTNAAFYHNRGMLLYDGGHYETAIADFSQSLRFEPNNVETLCIRAQAFAKLKRNAEALADFDRAIAADPASYFAWGHRGWFFANHEDWNQALASWQKAHSIAPERPRNSYLIGHALCELGSHLQAEPYLDRAVTLGEREPACYMWRGVCRYRRGETAGALDDLNVALQLRPDHLQSLYYRGQFHHDLGNHFQAFEDYSALIRLGDDGPRVRRQRGELYMQAGRNAEAWADLDAALQMGSDDLSVYRLRAGMLQRSGHADRAEIELQRMDQAARERIARMSPDSVNLPAAVVQANARLWTPGDEDAYCDVIFSFDPAWSRQPARLEGLAGILKTLKGLGPADPNLRKIDDMLSNEAAFLYRRRPLPMNVTEGATIYLADLLIYRRFLPDRMITNRLLPIRAEPGDQGRIELLPPDLT